MYTPTLHSFSEPFKHSLPV
uniref:Uncharacterized protein n=1 Tax=Anguilla anguilla TaxID=7936 RepID=A0A0E9U358_ANGAN